MFATHFITIKTFHRKRIFQNELYGEIFTESLMRWRQAEEALVHDYVIMPDHVHLLVSAGSAHKIAEDVRKLQRVFSDELSRQYGYAGEIWDSYLRDIEVTNAMDCERCAQMIHSNPVRVGFCEKDGEYRMSSKSSRWVLDPVPESLRAEALQTA